MNNLTISGKKYPVHFGLNAIMKYCRKKGIEFNQFQKEMSFEKSDDNQFGFTLSQLENMANFIVCGIEVGLKKQNDTTTKVPDMEDIIEMFENPDEANTFFDAFAQTVPESDHTDEGNQQSLKV